jgi:paraquat-inducible protein B
MKKDVNTIFIGAFMLGAVVLAIIVIFALGEGNLFRKNDRYVLYFTGSVKGLSVGAPVTLKGITIGQVVDINPIYDASDNSFLNQVIFQVPETIVQIIGQPQEDGLGKKLLTTDTTIDNMIDSGLRAKLQLQSVLTGQLQVAFDFFPDTPIRMMRFDDNLREYPTLPSEMETLAKTLEKIDLQVIAESISSAAQGIDKLANSPDLHETLVSIHTTINRYGQLAANLDNQVSRLATGMKATLADTRQLINSSKAQLTPMATGITDTAVEVGRAVANLNSRLDPLLENMETTTAAARDAFQQAQVMLGNLSHLSDQDSALIYRIDRTMTELGKAASSLSALADYLNRHPEALLRGKNKVDGNQ